MDNNEKTLLSDVIKIEYLNPDNAEFTDKNGIISMKYKPDNEEKKEYDRVFLHRNFPNEMADEYISVLDRDNNEIGMIRNISCFDELSAEILKRELKRKYRIFTISKITSVKEKYGYSYWNITDETGDHEFTVQDTYRSITKITSDRIYVTDIDGNRYEIPSLSELDRKSAKRIEIFL